MHKRPSSQVLVQARVVPGASLHDDVAEQVTSAGNTQTAESLVFMQLWPAGQSVDARQATWHTPEVQTREPPQSLLRMQVPPTSIFFAELQLAASHTETAIKSRTRDTDISILQAIATRKAFWHGAR